MKCAIAICTCNRGPLLKRLLRSLNGVELGHLDPSGFEVIVVDNAPSGQVRALGDRLSGDLPFALHVVEEPQRGISFARNRAVAEALDRGAEFVAFIDDDDLPRPDWLLRLMEKQEETEAELVFGVWRPLIGDATPSWASKLPMLSHRKNGVAHKYGVGLPRGVATCNVLIGRGVLEKLAAQGPVFKPEFALIGGGDIEFFVRAIKNQTVFALADTSVVMRDFDSSRMTVRGVLRLAFRRGSSNMHIAKMHGTPKQIRRRRNKAFRKIALGILLVPVTVFSKPRFVKNLYEISNKLGCLHGMLGRRYKYYQY